MAQTLPCPTCGKNKWGEFIQYNSYYTQCLSCQTEGAATTFINYATNLTGVYAIYDITKNKTLIAKGNIQHYISLIDTKANRGQLILIDKEIL